MRRSWLVISVLALMGISSVGCQNKMYDENLGLHRQVREQQAELTRLRMELGQRPDPAALAQMQQQNAALNAQIAQLQQQLQQPAPGAPASESLGDIAVTRDPSTGDITVALPGDVLFDSGKAELKASARTTLTKVANAIKKDYPGKRVLVDGYTDTDPINKTKEKWEDNLDLSAARSRAVANFLVEQGLAQSTVGKRAFGDTKPKGSKPASRRVEIVVATR